MNKFSTTPSLDKLRHVQTDFSYDLSGNRTRAVIDTRGEETRTINYSYNEAGELTLKTDSRYGTTHFSYDASGNKVTRLQSSPGSAETLTTFSFDALGRLEAISEGERLLLAALYDADDNRVFSALRDPDPALGDTAQARRLFLAAGNIEDSAETTMTLSLQERSADTEPDTSYDLFLYGVAQGMSN